MPTKSKIEKLSLHPRLKIFLASDHAGYEAKNSLLKKISENKNIHPIFSTFEWIDLGPFNKDSVDYPDYAHRLTEKISSNLEDSMGILICGSGQGMSMTANKSAHIRAALCWNENITELSRSHNNANVICIGARFHTEEEIFNMIIKFFSTDFEGGRHQNRLNKMSCS